MIFERRLVCSRLRPSRHRWLAARYNQAPGPGSGSRLGSAARRWDRERRKRVGQPRSWPSGVLPARFWEACCRHEEKERERERQSWLRCRRPMEATRRGPKVSAALWVLRRVASRQRTTNGRIKHLVIKTQNKWCVYMGNGFLCGLILGGRR